MSEFEWPAILDRLLVGAELSRNEAKSAMAEVMEGRATPAQIAAFIVGMRAKGETADEMTGMVEAMLDAAVTVDVGEPVVDTAGTGGDKSGTFNISTTAAFIAAGAGAKIAKHGNRAASSKTGSADVLEALGMKIELAPDHTVQMVREVGFGFFFAPAYHPAMRHAGPVRRELGVRTVFNFLGPLANPARARFQALGVSDAAMAKKMVRVLANLGAEAAFVYYGEDGLDELTTTGPSFIYRLKRGEITHAEFTPEDFGVPRATLADLQGGDAAVNAAITQAVLGGERGPHRDISLVNASPAIVAAGLADGFTEAMHLAEQAVDSGDALGVLQRAVAMSHGTEA
ncbi:MAG: anthranilate phosphoribosyltransferase [Acidimicrobiia bacterium]|nr:anthranilate phosphoribosyltransferase [Acidimicrobiia bacterium]